MPLKDTVNYTQIHTTVFWSHEVEPPSKEKGCTILPTVCKTKYVLFVCITFAQKDNVEQYENFLPTLTTTKDPQILITNYVPSSSMALW